MSDLSCLDSAGQTPVSTATAVREADFEFRGTAAEYFRIWIVNVLLSVVTLGIYSAWAKVRTRQYFYRNTFVDGASFEYLADPIMILKGRIIIAVALGVFAASQYVSLALYFASAVGLLLLAPWVLVSANRFNARNSAYRNIPFAFIGSVGQAYGVQARAALLHVFTLGLGAPFAHYMLTDFVASNHHYGNERFCFRKTGGDYFGVYFVAFVMSIGIVVVVAGVAGVLLTAAFSGTPPSRTAWSPLRVARSTCVPSVSPTRRAPPSSSPM